MGDGIGFYDTVQLETALKQLLGVFLGLLVTLLPISESFYDNEDSCLAFKLSFQDAQTLHQLNQTQEIYFCLF